MSVLFFPDQLKLVIKVFLKISQKKKKFGVHISNTYTLHVRIYICSIYKIKDHLCMFYIDEFILILERMYSGILNSSLNRVGRVRCVSTLRYGTVRYAKYMTCDGSGFCLRLATTRTTSLQFFHRSTVSDSILRCKRYRQPPNPSSRPSELKQETDAHQSFENNVYRKLRI